MLRGVQNVDVGRGSNKHILRSSDLARRAGFWEDVAAVEVEEDFHSRDLI